MKISPVSSFEVIHFTSIDKTKPVSKESENRKEKFVKAMPYIVGAAVLAVSGYAFRGKISKILKKTPKLKEPHHVEQPKIEQQKFNVSEISEITKPIETVNAPIVSESPIIIKSPKIEHPQIVETKIIEESTATTKEIFTHFDNEGKPVYEMVELPLETTPPASIFSEALAPLKLNDEKILSKIDAIRTAENKNITRILNENTHNGIIDIPMMKKVASDYMNDTQRGDTRFHQAADLLEQTHIKAYLKGDAKERSGIFNLTDSVLTDPILYRAYQNMPIEESAVRLNRIKEQEIKSDKYIESMDAQGFFDKTFQRLVEKYQFKKYNEAHGFLT